MGMFRDLHGQAPTLDYRALTGFLRAGLRRGTWFRLSLEDRALYRCGLWVAEARGKVSSMRLMVALYRIILKLAATLKARIIRAGVLRAQNLYELFAERRIFRWAPELGIWLRSRDYIAYLGVLSIFG